MTPRVLVAVIAVALAGCSKDPVSAPSVSAPPTALPHRTAAIPPLEHRAEANDEDDDGPPDHPQLVERVASDQDGPTHGDRDGDHIPDALDRCPDQAEDFDGFQDVDGCPDPDVDSDDVIDIQDRCPDSPDDDADETDGCPG